MANTSILAAFERMWQHVVAALNKKADKDFSNVNKETARENLGIEKITVDTAMSSTSKNPVQNKVVNAAINGLSNTYATKTVVEAMEALVNEANSDTRVKYENEILQTLDGLAIQLGGDLKVSTGSYTGTGKHGESNPNTLTFDIDPYFVVIIGCYNSTYNQVTWGNFMRGSTYGVSESVAMADGSTGLITLYVTWTGKSINFYSQVSAPLQLNSSSVTYNYVVIGK